MRGVFELGLLVVLAFVIVAVVFQDNPLVKSVGGYINAQTNAGARAIDESALRVQGKASCPEKTTRSTTVRIISRGTPIRVKTTATAWSTQIKLDGKASDWTYDQSFGLCILRQLASGELTVEYRLAARFREGNPDFDLTKATTVAFATPEGPMSVKVSVR